MKYIISESRLKNAMEKVFNQYINLDEIQTYNPIEETDDGEEYEDTTKTIYYVGDYYDDSDELFRYYECEYFNENAFEIRKKCPLISLDDRIKDTFDALFNNLWVEPFRIWINHNLDLKVKTVDYEYFS